MEEVLLILVFIIFFICGALIGYFWYPYDNREIPLTKEDFEFQINDLKKYIYQYKQVISMNPGNDKVIKQYQEYINRTEVHLRQIEAKMAEIIH